MDKIDKVSSKIESFLGRERDALNLRKVSLHTNRELRIEIGRLHLLIKFSKNNRTKLIKLQTLILILWNINNLFSSLLYLYLKNKEKKLIRILRIGFIFFSKYYYCLTTRKLSRLINL